jgi:hypothetical protein
VRTTRLIPWLGGALTTLGVLLATAPRGPGLTPDGMSYLAAAQSLVRTGSLREPFAAWNAPDSTSPLADYPAGFSLVLAVPIALGAAPPQAARWVEALSAGAAVGLASALLDAVAGTAAAALGAGLLLLLPALTDVSLLVLSEPLFLLVLVSVMAEMVRRPSRPLVAGLLAGAGNLVRYAGAFLVAGVAIWSALQPGSWRQRIGRGAAAALPGAALHLYWRVAGIDPGGGLSSSAYGGVLQALREGWSTGLSWLVPGGTGVPALVAGIALLLLLVVAGGVAFRIAGDEVRRLFGVSALLAVLYCGTVGFARLYVIPDVPFDSRILLPLFFILSLATAAALGIHWRERRRRAVPLALVIGWCALAVVRDARVVGNARRWGLNYETAEWQTSPVADWLRGPGRGRALYSTDPAGIWYLTGRPSRLLPDTLDPDSVRAFRAKFESRPSALVAFDVPFDVMAPADSVVQALSLTPVARFAHGVVWVEP